MKRLVLDDVHGRRHVKADPIAIPQPPQLGLTFSSGAKTARIPIADLVSVELVDDEAEGMPPEITIRNLHIGSRLVPPNVSIGEGKTHAA